jgi:hypothetical protein
VVAAGQPSGRRLASGCGARADDDTRVREGYSSRYR